MVKDMYQKYQHALVEVLAQADLSSVCIIGDLQRGPLDTGVGAMVILVRIQVNLNWRSLA
jgi:hypothetical protein